MAMKRQTVRQIVVAALLALGPVLGATAAPAQDAPASAPEPEAPTDWTVVTRPERDMVAATAAFSNGVTLIARCQAGSFDLIVSGLPEPTGPGPTRELGVQVGEEASPKFTAWTVGEQNEAAFSRLPARVARQLAKGGSLQIIIPASGEGGRRTRYVMSLEPSSVAIAQTLTACGRPLVDPRAYDEAASLGNGQDGLPGDVEWAYRPRPSFPDAVNNRMVEVGYAVMSCLGQADGVLSQCVVESEAPAGYGMGQAVLESMRRARVRLTPQGEASGYPLAGRLLIFTVNFRLQ